MVAKCHLLWRPLDQIGRALVAFFFSVIATITVVGLLSEAEVAAGDCMVAGASVWLTTLITAIFLSRFRNKLYIHHEGIGFDSDGTQVAADDAFARFADIYHLGLRGRRITLGTRTDRGAPIVRTAVLSRFRVEDVHDLLLERLQEQSAGHLYSLVEDDKLAASRPYVESELFPWQQQTRLVSARAGRSQRLELSTDRSQCFISRWNHQQCLGTDLARIEEPDKTVISVNEWGAFSGHGFMFARLGFVLENKIHVWPQHDHGPLSLERGARTVSQGGETIGRFVDAKTTLWRLDLKTPLPEAIALTLHLLWMHWDAWTYTRSKT